MDCGRNLLTGRVAVITGSASGIGLATARLFAAHGARLALVDRDAAALETAAQALPGALALAGDVGCEATITAHARTVFEALGSVDVLVTAAGWSNGRAVPDCDLADWRAVLSTNLDGTFLWAREVVRQMLAADRGGSIVFLGSQLAQAGGRSNAAYLASKGAVASLARSMALDHAAAGIRVNTVLPGAIDTPLLARAFARAIDPDAARAASAARHAMGRLGQPEEVAQAILWLASDASSFTTGACLPVEGGWLVA